MSKTTGSGSQVAVEMWASCSIYGMGEALLFCLSHTFSTYLTKAEASNKNHDWPPGGGSRSLIDRADDETLNTKQRKESGAEQEDEKTKKARSDSRVKKKIEGPVRRDRGGEKRDSPEGQGMTGKGRESGQAGGQATDG